MSFFHNKKNILLLIIVIVIIILSFILINKKKQNIMFYLNGEESVVINNNNPYVEQSFVALNGFNQDISDYVKISGIVNADVAGLYQLTYELSYAGIKQTLVRSVYVTTSKEDTLELRLNGEEDVYVSFGSDYYENGAYLYDNVNNIVLPAEININSSVDINSVGVYSVYYEVEYNNIKKTAERRVHVFDIPYTLSESNITMSNVIIKIDIRIITPAIMVIRYCMYPLKNAP